MDSVKKVSSRHGTCRTNTCLPRDKQVAAVAHAVSCPRKYFRSWADLGVKFCQGRAVPIKAQLRKSAISGRDGDDAPQRVI